MNEDIHQHAADLAHDAIALIEAADKIRDKARKQDLLRSAAAICKVVHDLALRAAKEAAQ